MTNLQPLRGFRDLYPKEKGVQRFIFETLQKVADDLGYESYDGPVVEPMDLYLSKTSKELIERQTFQIKDKKGGTIILRPEMTPTLARMIAAKAGELTFPLKLFNFGVRFRYEAPQKGRSREFNQADFDILGGDEYMADAEIINTVISIFRSFDLSENDFVVYVNSRSGMQDKLLELGFKKEKLKEIFNLIDKQDKIKDKIFVEELLKLENDKKKIAALVELLYTPPPIESSPFFQSLARELEVLNLMQYCKVNYNTVRGLDYYTSFVFEVREPGAFQLKRALAGGGRYDNLVSDYNPKVKISGVGFAVSDVILESFLKEKNKIPTILTKKTRVLVTIFSLALQNESLGAVRTLREKNIPTELYLELDKKLDRQLKYADKTKIPYVIIIGPEEKEKNVVKLKDMRKRTEETLTLEQVVKKLS